ncbi:hypothetical protein Aduo_006832 [Ancylostoma duodenale]
MKMKVTMTAVFLAVLIIGTTLSVILTVALTSRAGGENSSKRKVVYFAMYLGDDEGKKTPSRGTRSIFQADDGSKACSLELNKENTKFSIQDMKGSDQLYSFILYTTKAKSTTPRKADDAITELGNITATKGEQFKQLAAVEKFLKERRDDDVLVFYIPCKFDYNQRDTQEFVEELKRSGAQATTMLVSNTKNSSDVAEVYNINKDNVVGKGDKVAEKIRKFAEDASATTATAFTTGTTESITDSTSAAVTTTSVPASATASTSTEPTETTTVEVPSTASTSPPVTAASTLTTTVTENVSTATSVAEETSTKIAETSTSTVETSPTEAATTATTSGATEATTGSASSTSTVMSSSSTVPSTSPTTGRHFIYNCYSAAYNYCFHVNLYDHVNLDYCRKHHNNGDSYNPGSINDSIDTFPDKHEHRSHHNRGAYHIDGRNNDSITTTLEKHEHRNHHHTGAYYNYGSNNDSINTVPDKHEHRSHHNSGTYYKIDRSNFSINTIPNNLRKYRSEKKGNACLVEEDATSTTTTTEPSTTKATESPSPPTSAPTSPSTATTATEPAPETETSPTTTVTTTAPKKENITCIFVADAYNFGSDGTGYTQEKYLIGNMSEYFFKSTVKSKAGITKYGYVSTFDIRPAFNALKEKQEEFVKVIDTAPDEDIEEPFATAEAIEIINDFTKVEGKANSLIFFSAQKDTKKLPKLEPKSKDWKRIIAVGFNDTDLNNVVDKEKGVAVRVPYNFSMTDVKNVIDALLAVF